MAKTPAPKDQTPDETAAKTAAETAVARNTESTTANERPSVAPTEQFPFAPPTAPPAGAPGSASPTGINSGANGYSDLTRADAQPSVFRRHPVATGVTAAVIAIIVVSGLTAWGVGAAVTSSLASSTSSVSTTSTATPAPTPGTGAAGRLKAAGRVAFRASIQSISGESWTILTRKGKTVTVDVTGSTQFGTRKAAATSGSFAIGDSVIIVATKGSAGTITATRVVSATGLSGGTAPSTPAPSDSATPNT
jgi:hypothetical protein